MKKTIILIEKQSRLNHLELHKCLQVAAAHTGRILCEDTHILHVHFTFPGKAFGCLFFFPSTSLGTMTYQPTASYLSLHLCISSFYPPHYISPKIWLLFDHLWSDWNAKYANKLIVHAQNKNRIVHSCPLAGKPTCSVNRKTLSVTSAQLFLRASEGCWCDRNATRVEAKTRLCCVFVWVRERGTTE